MRSLLPIVAAVLWTGCSTPELRPFDPTKPHRYRVLRGDTWQSISSKREVEPEQIREWNGLRAEHVLIPGQVLWVFPKGKGAPAPGEHPAVAAARFFDPQAPPPTVAPLGVPRSVPHPEDDQAVASGEAPVVGGVGAAPAPRRKVAGKTIDGPTYGAGGTALLSLLDDVESGTDLRAVPSIQPTGAPVGGALAGRRGGLAGGGEVDRTDVEIDRVVKDQPGVAGPAAIPKLPKAEPKQCLAATFDQDIGDYGMAAAGGLGRSQIKKGMRPALMALQGCLPGGGDGPHELHVEISLGCDGLVYQTHTVKNAGLPSPVLDCVEKVVAQASFDAAAGATTFLYPIVIGY